MTGWASDDLAALAGDEIRIASSRPDGSLRPFVRIWFVVVDGALYVRSAYGPDNGWYRRSKAAGAGAIRTMDGQRDVTFEVPDAVVAAAVSEAYRAKYERYPAAIVATVVSDTAEHCTLRLAPR